MKLCENISTKTKEGTMKNNNTNKKAVTILSLAMVLALPITSNADGQETEENVQNTPNYTGAGTETKLEEEIKNILAEEPEITLTVEKEADKDLTVEENTKPVTSTEKPAEVRETTSVDESASDSTTENKEETKEETTLAEESEAKASLLKNEARSEDELELSEEADPEALKAGEETEAGRDISNDITEAEIHVGNTETPGVLKAGDGEGLAWSVAFKAPEDTKPGDYFDIVLSDNWTLKGIEPDTEAADPIMINDKIVADGKRLSRQTIRYTFNDNITNLDNIRVAVQYGDMT